MGFCISPGRPKNARCPAFRVTKPADTFTCAVHANTSPAACTAAIFLHPVRAHLPRGSRDAGRTRYATLLIPTSLFALLGTIRTDHGGGRAWAAVNHFTPPDGCSLCRAVMYISKARLAVKERDLSSFLLNSSKRRYSSVGMRILVVVCGTLMLAPLICCYSTLMF